MQVPEVGGYGFGSTMIVSGLAILPSALGGAILAASTIDLGPAHLPSLHAYRELFAMCAGAALPAALAAVVIHSLRPEAPADS